MTTPFLNRNGTSLGTLGMNILGMNKDGMRLALCSISILNMNRFLYRALDALGSINQFELMFFLLYDKWHIKDLSIANEFRQALDDINPTQPDLTGFKQVPPQSLETPQTCGNITLVCSFMLFVVCCLIVVKHSHSCANYSLAVIWCYRRFHLLAHCGWSSVGV